MRFRVLNAILLAFILLAWTPAAAFAGPDAGTGEIKRISIAEAIEMGLDNSKAYMKAARAVDVALIDRDNARDAFDSRINANYNAGSGTWTYDENYETAQNAYYGGQAGYDAAVLQYDLVKDRVEFSVIEKYYRLLELEEKLVAARASLDRDELQFKAKKAYAALGMATEMELIQAESKYTDSRTKLDEAQRDLENGRRNFKELLGLNEEADFILADEIKYAPAELPEDLDKLFTVILYNDPAIRMAEINADLYNDMVGYYKTDKDELEADKERLAADILKDAMRKVLRELHGAILDLEESYTAMEKKLKMAEESYRIKNGLFRAGMATGADMVSVGADLAAARQGLQAIVINHELVKEKYYRPWLVAPATGGSL